MKKHQALGCHYKMRILLCTVLYISFCCCGPSLARSPENCFISGCHEDMEEGFTVHPESSLCTDCHTGNFADHDQLDVRLGLNREKCFECHQGMLQHKHRHAPTSEGRCESCHNPHENGEKLFLRRNYPLSFYVDYVKGRYDLCFQCHKPEMIMYPETAFSTGFRNGLQNLHYLHVNREKRGRNCSVCHGVHGTGNEKLIVEDVAFGEWTMPVNFKITGTGGSCAPGCHRPRRYDRKNHE